MFDIFFPLSSPRVKSEFIRKLFTSAARLVRVMKVNFLITAIIAVEVNVINVWLVMVGRWAFIYLAFMYYIFRPLFLSVSFISPVNVLVTGFI